MRGTGETGQVTWRECIFRLAAGTQKNGFFVNNPG
jgi:hypothetical protein